MDPILLMKAIALALVSMMLLILIAAAAAAILLALRHKYGENITAIGFAFLAFLVLSSGVWYAIITNAAR